MEQIAAKIRFVIIIIIIIHLLLYDENKLVDNVFFS